MNQIHLCRIFKKYIFIYFFYKKKDPSYCTCSNILKTFFNKINICKAVVVVQISWNGWQIVQKYLSAGNSKCALFDTFYKSNRLSVIRIKISKELLPTFPTFFLYAQIENGIFAMQSNTFGICCDVFFVIKKQQRWSIVV